MIIYKAVNKIDGKCYIGQTVRSLKYRKNCHLWEVDRNNTNVYFHNAIRKYGKENFEWSVIEECNTKNELDEMEFHYIKQYNSFKPGGYNLTIGGNKGTYGWIPSKETRRKISEGNKGKIVSSKTRKKISKSHSGKNNPMYGKKRPDQIGDLNPAKRPEVRKKISEANKGRKRPDLAEKNRKNTGKTYEEIYGKEKADQIKKKKSISAKNNNVGKFKRTDEIKENMRLAKVKYLYQVQSPTGEEYIINSICKFAKDNNLNKASLFYHMKHKTNNHKGWIIYKCQDLKNT